MVRLGVPVILMVLPVVKVSLIIGPFIHVIISAVHLRSVRTLSLLVRSVTRGQVVTSPSLLVIVIRRCTLHTHRRNVCVVLFKRKPRSRRITIQDRLSAG